jgi:hypothetical protein
MDRPIDFRSAGGQVSGAPEAGGSTTFASRFGGDSLEAHLWRFVARVARDVEAAAYRRLRDLEQRSQQNGEAPHPGAPRRARGVGTPPH